MNMEWVRSARDQCRANDVSFFLKQKMEGRLKVSLPFLDGKQYAEVPCA
jgi:protein gp37